MSSEPNFFQNLQAELSNGRVWLERAIVLAYAVAAGLLVVGFTVLSDWAFAGFVAVHRVSPWLMLVWTPLVTGGIVWCTRRWAPGAAGSGIPQVVAALDPEMPAQERHRFVSLRLSLSKIVLGAAGFVGGLSIGREGPSVQVAAGVMQHAKRWMGPRSGMSEHALLVAGGAAGIAAAFNAPLAGVVFAIEELSRKLESRNSGLIITAIVLAGLMGVSAFGNHSYFGVIRAPQLTWGALWPGLLVTIACGLLGGLFARLMAESLTGAPGRFNDWRRRFPIRFAVVGGLAVGVIGLVSNGTTFGAGSEAVKHMLAGHSDVPALYVLLKFVATWLTAWCGVPGGIFAPSLSIGAGVGHDIATLTGSVDLAPALIAMGMAAFLAAVTQAPLTAFIIVMEMVDGHSLVLSLMTAAMLSSLVSRLLTRPLYETLADAMVGGARTAAAARVAAALPAELPAPNEAQDATPTQDPAPAATPPADQPRTG